MIYIQPDISLFYNVFHTFYNIIKYIGAYIKYEIYDFKWLQLTDISKVKEYNIH